jgi:hypothetical protein
MENKYLYIPRVWVNMDNVERHVRTHVGGLLVNVPPQFRSDWSADCFAGSAAIIVVSEAGLMIGLGEERERAVL